MVLSIERMYAERSMVLWLMPSSPTDNPRIELRDNRVIAVADETIIALSVSYTHLTLPSNREV